MLQKVLKLKQYFDDGLIPTLAEHEVNPGLDPSSRENYLYFTLPVCINFQRSSPAMWRAALSTYQDSETNYLFYPEQVVQFSREKIQKDLLKHKLGLQLNKHTDIWVAISTAMSKNFKSDPRELFKTADFDVVKALDLIQNRYKGQFPYLRGPKLSNYWLFILTSFTDLKLKNMNEISIIPDTHIIKSSEHLGLVPKDANQAMVIAAWRELLKDHQINPVEMHPVLWNWSRAGFEPAV